MPRTATILIALLIAAGVSAQRTTRRGLRASQPAATECAAVDTVAVTADSITLSGYDKPLRSRTESMFVSNHTGRTVAGLRLRIEYFDLSGRSLHARECDIAARIPAGSTRQISFPSWDRQLSFYYRLSSKPRRADAAPYNVRCSVIHILTTDN